MRISGWIEKSSDLLNVDEQQDAEKGARPSGVDAHSLEVLEKAKNDAKSLMNWLYSSPSFTSRRAT